MKTIRSIFLGILGASLFQLTALSEESLFSEVGIRVGFDAENRVNLVSYEGFGKIETGWSWSPSDSIQIDLDIETAIGALSGEGETAAYGRIGPIAEVSFEDLPISIVLSSGPSLYSEDTFDDYDIGGNFQFTSSIGLKWDICESWALSYRFQHTSNADIDDPNPGLDMHTVGLAFRF